MYLYRERKSGLIPYIFPKLGKLVGNLLLVLLQVAGLSHSKKLEDFSKAF